MNLSKVRTFCDVLATLCVIGASGLLAWTTLTRGGQAGGTAQRVAPNPVITDVSDADVAVTLHRRPGLAPESGRLALVEFSDFQCPFSSKYARETLGRVLETFVNSGRAEYVFAHYPLESIHPFAVKAAECAAEQNRFWDMHRILFANQSTLTAAELPRYAKDIGLSTAQFATCLRGMMEGRVRQSIAEAERAGVGATPTFGIGRVDGDRVRIFRLVRGAVPFEVLDEQVRALERQGT